MAAAGGDVSWAGHNISPCPWPALSFTGFISMSAIVWIGGMVFASWVLQPVLSRSLAASVRMPLYREMGKRFLFQRGADILR